MSEEKHTRITRRVFLKGATSMLVTAGTMSLIPKLDDGPFVFVSDALGPREAHAEGAEGVGSVSTQTFDVVGRDQVGFVLQDVANDNEPVQDATITIKSKNNGKVATGTTNSDGKAIISIGELALKDSSDQPLDGIYQCHVEVHINTDDARIQMRNYSTGRAALEGASGIIIGMHELEDTDDVYVERITMDEWDMHYFTGTYLRSELNQSEHKIFFGIQGVKSGTQPFDVTLQFLDAKDKKTAARKSMSAKASYDEASGLYAATFADYFFWLGRTVSVIDKDEVILRFTFTYGGKTYETDEVISVQDTPVDEASFAGMLCPISTDAEKLLTFSATTGWPVFKGASISLIDLNFPVQFSFVAVAAMLGFGTDFAMRDEKGNLNPNAWKEEYKENVIKRYKKQFTKQKNAIEHGLANKKKPFLDKDGNATNAIKKNTFKCCDLSIVFRMVFGLQWTGFEGDTKLKKRTFEGEVTITGGIDLEGTYTTQFVAGGVPVFVALSAELEVLFSLLGATRNVVSGSNRNLPIEDTAISESGQFNIDITGTFKATLGAGIQGVASIGVCATLAFPLHLGFKEDPDLKKANPHVTFDVIIRLDIVAQLLLLKGSITFWDYKGRVVDNWPSKALEDGIRTGMEAYGDLEPRFAFVHPDEDEKRFTLMAIDPADLTIEDVVNSLVVISNTELELSNEATARTGSSNTPAGDIPMMLANKAPVFVELEDGSFDVQLVDCEGANTFIYGTAEDAEAYGVHSSSVEEPEPVEEPPTIEGQDVEGASVVEGADVVEPEDQDTDEPQEGEAEGDPQAASAIAVEAASAVGSVVAEANGQGEGQGQANDQDGDPAIEPAEEPVESAATEDPYLGNAAPDTGEWTYDFDTSKTTGEPCPPASEAWASMIEEQTQLNEQTLLNDKLGEGTEEHIIAANNGIVPAVDVVLYKNVFSDPRHRVIVVDGTPYMFRITTVAYPGGDKGVLRRSRVVVSKFDTGTRTWGVPQVVEYSSNEKNLARLDIFDYDFDVITRASGSTWAGGAEVCLIVAGGTRPVGPDGSTSLYDVFTNPTIAVVVLGKNLEILQRSVRSVGNMYGNDGKYHMIMCPRVTDNFAPKGEGGALGFSFLTRTANNKDEIMTDRAEVSFAVGYFFIRKDLLSFDVNLNTGTSMRKTAMSLEVVAGGDPKNSVMEVLIECSDGYDVWTAVIKSGGTFQKNLELLQNITSTDVLTEVQPWPTHGSYLFAKPRPEDGGKNNDYHVYEGTFDLSKTKQPRFTPKQVDMNCIKGAVFCVSPNGDYLFYAETFKGDPQLDPSVLRPDVPKDSTSAVHYLTHNDGTQDVNRIMACRLVDGKFSEDFPFCELSYPVDQLRCASIDPKDTIFITNEITDLTHNLGRLHYIGVPTTLVGEIGAFELVDPYLYAGTTSEFSVDVRNHGNRIISEFDIQLLDAKQGYAVVDTCHVDLSKTSGIQLTASSRSWAEALTSDSDDIYKLNDQEKQGMLMPGKTVSYQMSFSIPADWTGDREVAVRMTNAKGPVVSAEGFVPEAADEDDDVLKYFHAGVQGTVTVQGAQDSAQLYDPDERIYTPKTSDKTGSTASTAKRATPKTGDATNTAGPLGLAIGGLGAAFAAYSARRSKLEDEFEDE